MRVSTTLCAALLAAATFQSGSAFGQGKTASGFTVHETAPEAVKDVYELYKKNFGFVPNLAKVMADSPALLKSYTGLQNNLQQHGKLSQAEINVVQLTIAVENKCEYCTAGHTMAGKMFFKTPDDWMASIRARQAPKDAKTQALQRFALMVYNKRGEVPADELQKFLEAGYTRAQALDVVTCVAAKVMSNYTNSLAKTELDEPLKPLAEGLDFDDR